jgi:predicted AlkP superfamily phosphohydrolase/phosphomutase
VRQRFTGVAVAIGVAALSICLVNQDGSGSQLAYIGPGAGFAFLGSFLALVGSVLWSLVSLLVWPARKLWRIVCRRQGFRKARVRKLIFLGLDGLDPNLAERFMAEGKLPNMSRLRETGSYRRLRTTFPALSPVAWSTFATGVNPAKHNIFDFLNRDLRSYVPELSSAKVRPPQRVLRIGKFRIPLSRPSIEMRRKSEPFWKILGRHGIGSTILRVPITFPPDQFNGRLLSAMSTPDLQGTQGSFSWFTTAAGILHCEGGNRYPLHRVQDWLEGELEGPTNSFVENGGSIRIPFRIRPRAGAGDGLLEIEGSRYTLRCGEYSPWITLRFRSGVGASVSGIARFLLTRASPEISLYVTPLQIDPANPALPISHPSYYAMYLAKLLGSLATLGMAEDTWALNEGAIDEDAFLKQAELIKQEREAMFLSALERTRQGVVACVFDTSDRVQHMFFRYLDGKLNGHGRYRTVIEDLYRDMDRLVGKTLIHAAKDTAVFVLSDHGFCSFRRSMNLNSWLRENGYLSLQNGSEESGNYFEGVDWGRTRAYALGLSGLYLNLKGRERGGIVPPEGAAELARELISKLSGLRDAETGDLAIREAYASASLYRGPYLDAAPDVIMGYAEGYRISWEAAVGKTTGRVFEDNAKAWSGDHCVDPPLVPGVLFSNRILDTEDPGIEDMAPTALGLFGVPRPAWMEGKPVFGFE